VAAGHRTCRREGKFEEKMLNMQKYDRQQLSFKNSLILYLLTRKEKTGVEKKLDCSKNTASFVDFEPKMIRKIRADNLCSGLVRKSLRPS
jgi:hypothetical protein